MYSQLGGGVSPQMRRAINRDLGRPVSVVSVDTMDGNMSGRMRSRSELPSKLRQKKIPDFPVMCLYVCVCACVCTVSQVLFAIHSAYIYIILFLQGIHEPTTTIVERPLRKR